MSLSSELFEPLSKGYDPQLSHISLSPLANFQEYTPTVQLTVQVTLSLAFQLVLGVKNFAQIINYIYYYNFW